MEKWKYSAILWGGVEMKTFGIPLLNLILFILCSFEVASLRHLKQSPFMAASFYKLQFLRTLCIFEFILFLFFGSHLFCSVSLERKDSCHLPSFWGEGWYKYSDNTWFITQYHFSIRRLDVPRKTSQKKSTLDSYPHYYLVQGAHGVQFFVQTASFDDIVHLCI